MIVNASKKLFTKITEDIELLNEERGFDFPYHYTYQSQEIGYIAQYLIECMVNNGIDFVYGKWKRKTGIQRWYDRFLGYYMKLNEYEYWLAVIGERNSCSKTDKKYIKISAHLTKMGEDVFLYEKQSKKRSQTKLTS